MKTGHYIAHDHYMFYVRVLVVRWVTLQYFKLLVPKVTADNVSFSMGTNFCVKCNWIAKRNVIWRERKERNYDLRSSRAVSTFIDLQLCILPTYYEKISLKLASFQTQALKCCARSGKKLHFSYLSKFCHKALEKGISWVLELPDSRAMSSLNVLSTLFHFYVNFQYFMYKAQNAKHQTSEQQQQNKHFHTNSILFQIFYGTREK